MNGKQWTDCGGKAYTAAEALDECRRVKINSDGKVEYADADHPGHAVTTAAAAIGEEVNVLFPNKCGTIPVAGSEAIAKGADIYAAADGKVQNTPTAAGTYYKLGVNAGNYATTADGGVVEAEFTGFEAVTVRSYTAGEALAAYRRVKFSGGKVEYADADDEGTLVTLAAADADAVVPVCLITEGAPRIAAAGVIAQDADAYAAADGKIQALPAGAGTYYRIGRPLAASAQDGDVVAVNPVGLGISAVVAP